MAIRQIIQEGNAFLRKKSREVTVFDQRLHTLLDDMKETMDGANGVGLAAVQVGVLRQVIVVDVGEDLIELINPKIIETSEETASEAEGCLSFPGQYGMVERPLKVKVEAQDRDGNLFTVEGEGLKARAFCHEIDHLGGVLFVDLVTEMIDADDAD
ncbi:peptide deformylase [Ruminococcaceae bacterium OttesenSCG-928-L11]|nr:peptide deformylase [Ruminococcaceae bacterium OttesenSCG-928-L11]